MLTESDYLHLKQFRSEIAQRHNKKSEDEFFLDPVCLKEYEMEIKKAQSRIPLQYRAKTLADLTNPQAKLSREYVQDYIDNIDEKRKKGQGLFLVGKSTGTGKTMSGSIVLMKALEKNYTTRFILVKECIDLLTASWKDEEAKQEFNEDLLGCDFLMLDDLGDELKSLISNLSDSTINTILRVRSNNLRPTILTSNVLAKDITTEYDNRIYSIIKGHARLIPFEGIDYRVSVLAPKLNKD